MRESLIVSNVCLRFERWGGLVAPAAIIVLRFYVLWHEFLWLLALHGDIAIDT